MGPSYHDCIQGKPFSESCRRDTPSDPGRKPLSSDSGRYYTHRCLFQGLCKKDEPDIRDTEYQAEMTRWPNDLVSESEWSERDAPSDPCHYEAATTVVGSAVTGVLLPRHA